MTALPPTVLVVEDDPSIGASLVKGLAEEGFLPLHAATGAAATQLLGACQVDLVVLDLGLPDADGLDLLPRWRRSHPELAVIVLTANTALEARLRSLELGAVDWMPKPFWQEELVLRIRMRLERQTAPATVLRWGTAELDLAAQSVTVAGAPVSLSPQEFRLLAFFVQNPDQALTRKRLSSAALDPADDRGERAVDTYVARLRRKLGAAGRAIQTVWGLGYRFRRG